MAMRIPARRKSTFHGSLAESRQVMLRRNGLSVESSMSWEGMRPNVAPGGLPKECPVSHRTHALYAMVLARKGHVSCLPLRGRAAPLKIDGF